MEAMEVIDVYNHPNATIVGLLSQESPLPHRQCHTKNSSKPTLTASSSE